MSDVNKTISIKYQAEVQNLVSGLTKVGNVSEKEARKIVTSLEKAYRKAARDSQKAAQKQKKELEKVARQAQKTGKAMNSSTKSMALGFATAGIAVLGFQQHIADLSNQLVDASTKTGVAVDTLAGLRLAAEGSGLSFENLEAGLIKLPSLMRDAAEGGSRASKAFDNLNVQVTKTDGSLKSSDDVLKDVFHSLQNIESAEEKAAAAADLFGQRAGPAFIQSGAIDNLEAFMGLANEFGVSTGPEMQKQMAEFQRVSSSALTLVQGEFSRLLNTAFGEGGINDGIILLSEGIIAFGTIAQQQIEIVSSGFSLVTGIVTNAYDAIMGGDIDEAVKRNNDNLKDLGEKFVGIGDIFGVIEERQTSFRKALQKTLDTPIRTGGAGAGVTPGGPTKEDKEALSMEKERISLQKFGLALSKENRKEDIKILNLQANLLEGEDKQLALLDAQLEALDLQKVEYIERMNAQIFALESVEGKEAEIEQIRIESQKRFEQFEQEKEAITLMGIDKVHEAREEATKQRQEAHEKEIQDEKDKQKLKMENIQKQMDAFSTVSNEFVSLGETSVELFERFSEKNKKNAEIAFNVRKGIAISEITINTASAVVRALAELGPVAGGLASGAIIATGAAQAALIASEEPKFHMGGLVGQSSLAPDEQRITAKSGEAVLSTSAVRRLGGEQGIQAIERGATPNPIVVVTNPYKHYDRFMKGRKRMGLDSTRTGRRGY